MITISDLKVEKEELPACPAVEDPKAGKFRNYHTELMKITGHYRSPAHRWTGGLLGEKKSYELAAIKGGGSFRSLAEWNWDEFLEGIPAGAKEPQNGEEIKLEEKAKQDLAKRCVVLAKQKFGVTGKLNASELPKKDKKADENVAPVQRQIDWNEGDCFLPVRQRRQKISQILATEGSITGSKVISDTANGAGMSPSDCMEENEPVLQKKKGVIEAGLYEIENKKWPGLFGARRRKRAERKLVAEKRIIDFRLNLLTARKQRAADEIKSCLAKEVDCLFGTSDDEGYRYHLVDMAYKAGANKDMPALENSTASPVDSRLKHWEASAQWLVDRLAADALVKKEILVRWPGVDDAEHRRLKKAALSFALKCASSPRAAEGDPSTGPNVMAGGTGELGHEIHLGNAVNWLIARYQVEQDLIEKIKEYEREDEAVQIRLFNLARAFACEVVADVPVNTQGAKSAEANAKGDKTIELDHDQYREKFKTWLEKNAAAIVAKNVSDTSALTQTEANDGEAPRSPPGEIATHKRPPNVETRTIASNAINSYPATTPAASDIENPPPVSRLRLAATNFGMGVALVIAFPFALPFLVVGWMGYMGYAIFFNRQRAEMDVDEGDATSQSLPSQDNTPPVMTS